MAESSTMTRKSAALILGLLLLAALGMRLVAITRPPMEFHPTRQYYGAKLARSLYYSGLKEVPAWKREVLRADTPHFIEPPLLESASVLGYRLAGEEVLWIPRTICVLFWLAGAVGLYLLGRSFLSRAGALFAVAYFLFAPYGVVASRSFQPDPIMVSLLVWALWAIVVYTERPNVLRFVVAVLLAAASVSVKPAMTAFVLATVFGVLQIRQLIIGKGKIIGIILTVISILLFSLLIVLPAAVYVWYGVTRAGFLAGQVGRKFTPELLLTGMFWQGWLRNLNDVFGLAAIVAAVGGSLMIRKGTGRWLAISYWAGYALFGLVFSYHTATHDYYHLQLLPLVGLGLAPWVEAAVARLRSVERPKCVVPALVLVGLALLATRKRRA